MVEFSLTKRRPGRKPQGEATGQSTKRSRYGRVNIGATPRKNTKTERLFDLNSDFEQRQNKIPSGKKQRLICILVLLHIVTKSMLGTLV